MDSSTSFSSVSNEPTPAYESSLSSFSLKHMLRRPRDSNGSRRHVTSTNDVHDSLLTPHRPPGAVPELFVTLRHVSLAVDLVVPPAAGMAVEEAIASPSSQETLAANQLPSMTNHIRGLLRAFTGNRTLVRRQILKNVTGAFTPGSMTLVLGRSGSGKSALLQLLSGRFNVKGKCVTLDGEVSYNGLSRTELNSQLPQCVAYVPQQDTHLSVMTVKETLEFASECCGVETNANPVSCMHKSPTDDYPRPQPTIDVGSKRDPAFIMRELGLTRCRNTIVGDNRIRGVSGGEKKRVTIGEMTVGAHAVSLLDEITTGLDSSTAFDVIHSQRLQARQQRQTVVMSLQQPSAEILALFDDILLLAEGEVLYHGPRAYIEAYFEALGLVCPPERDFAVFLCDLASPEQFQYEKLYARMPGRRRHPRSANEFADLWIMSPMYEAMVEELDYLDHEMESFSPLHRMDGERRRYVDRKALLRVPAFRQSYLRSAWTVTKRQMRLVVRDKTLLIGRVLMDVVVGLMLGSVYYGMELADPQVTLGVVFSCALFLGLGQSATLAPCFHARQVFYKHRDANFYRTSSYVLASCASQIPLAITEVLLFSSLVYWMGGFIADVELFGVFVLYMLLTVLVFRGEYFLLAATCSTLDVAQPASTFTLLLFILFAGFAVSLEQLPWTMRWIYWGNPLAWTTRGILVSQYRSPELDVCVYGGIDYCKLYHGQTLGKYSLGLYDVPDDPKWVLLGIAFLFTIYIATMSLSCVMLEVYRHEPTPALPPGLPVPFPSVRQANESYVMLVTPREHENEFFNSDVIDSHLAHDDDHLSVREDDDELNPSSHGSQGRQSVSKDMMGQLTPHWHVAPVTIAFYDLWYSITCSRDDPVTVTKETEAQGVSYRPRAPVDSCATSNEGKATVTRELLKGVTGYALPGTMTALMGSSGAGKTTLLDVLAGRKKVRRGNQIGASTLRGRVLLNGVEATDLAVRRCTGYCEQTDVHSDAATFREALQFSVYLRQGDRVSPERMEEMVDECLDLLGLKTVARHVIRGCSSEQLKRLSLGIELAAQPSVLFLDEPTSGLDARAAKSVMDGVRKVANAGRTVICTIHQPSTEVFLLFDSLLLLQRGGETVYFGDVGHNGDTVIKYFERFSVPLCAQTFKPGDNPATWILDVIGAGIGNDELNMSMSACKVQRAASPRRRNARPLDESLTSSLNSDYSRQLREERVDFVRAYKSSRLKERLDAKRAAPGVFLPSDRLPSVLFAHRRAASAGLQFSMLMRRFLRLYWRTPCYTFTRLVTAFTLGFVFGLVSSGRDDLTTYQGANGAVGLIFFSTCFLGVGAYIDVLPLAFQERGPFYRERASETYSALWYFAASSIVEIPYAALASMLFVCGFYPMAGFAAYGPLSQLVGYWLVLTLHILFQTYLGQLFTFLTPSIELAAASGALLDSIFLMFIGYNPPASSIPEGYKWLSQLVPPRYTFQMLTALILGDCPDELLDQIAQARATNTTLDVSTWPLGCQPLTDAPPAVSNVPLAVYIGNVYGARRQDSVGSGIVVVGILLLMRLVTVVVMRLVSHHKR
ncbi:hypothetical protein PsorP6_005841 [Peronosclerospora sorghi]|uniref:Uncharacterized protein n=1 Tax=Peronosclerospora sorghi TaxID=230839 RepID=A0ACC0W400_9STRA|nr:hypothetical protein PsorP6_005841 [Peronosclerospora sorghi]